MSKSPAKINDDLSDARKMLCDAMKSLPPPHALLHLLSIGVCARCVLRLFGYRGTVYSSGPLTALFLSVLEEKNNFDGSREENNLNSNGVDMKNNGEQSKKEVCIICLGILQFTSGRDQILMSESNVNHFVAEICKVVNREGYQVDGFSFEISVPPLTLANERAIWLYMKKKYEAEEWFQKKSASGSISLKETLRLSITSSLENKLNVRCGDSSFCIHLSYSNLEASRKLQTLTAGDHNLKKRKADAQENGNKANDMLGKRSKNSDDDPHNESDAVIIRSLSALQDHAFEELFTLPPEKAVEPTKLTVNCYRKPIYIGGRYLKFSRKVSQSRWIIDDERMGEASVEEIIGNNALLVSKGDGYKFHAAGREDIDVRMLGSGRPFLLEISNVRIIPTLTVINQIAQKINESDQKYIQVRNLSILGSEVWDLMREGEAEKQKQYAALVWIPRSLSDDDIHNLSSVKDLEILQRTPVRVLHRRSPLERKRIIHWMKIDRIDDNSQYFLLHLCTQAGTYIKEFVHGDLGRTYPNIGSMLGCGAEILRLDVTDIKMDLFTH